MTSRAAPGPERLQLARAGDEVNGYEVWVELEPAVLRMRLWGAWDGALATSYERSLDERYPLFEGRPYGVICDLRASPIQTPQVAEIRGRCIRKATAAGMSSCAYVVTRMLSRMQMRRLALASGCPRVEAFEDEAAARAWLLRP
jgi:hypothetical protein